MERMKVGVAGAGSVAGVYLTNLQTQPHVELVSICDIKPEKAVARGEEFGVPNRFASVGEMLAGPKFDLLLDATSIPSHLEVNREALEAGVHVWSEKPFAPTYDQGRELLDLAKRKGVHLWAAPTAVLSPQFRCMAEIIASDEIGGVHAAHGCYGHGGPGWGPWFYKAGGGCVFDLAVYNITTLTGLLGPVRAVSCFEGPVYDEREVEDEVVKVVAEENVMLLLDHGKSVYSHIQSGFCYGAHDPERTIELIGTKGALSMSGWDWEPHEVRCSTDGGINWKTRCSDAEGYTWECGVAHMAECLIEGKPSLITPEQALHVVEVMAAAHESARSGCRVAVESTFNWPIVG